MMRIHPSSKPLGKNCKCNYFNDDFSSGDKFNFQTKLVGRYIRLFPASFTDKAEIRDPLKQSNSQHYLIPNRKSLIYVVVRGLSESTDTEMIHETLSCTSFKIIKVSQMKSRRNKKSTSVISY